MRQQRRPLILWTLVILVSLLLPGSSSAQTGFRYSIGLLAGFGGALGSEPGSTTLNEIFVPEGEFDLGFQLFFNMEIQRSTLFGLRLGQLDLELDNNAFQGLFPPIETEMTYATAVGNYRLPAGNYQSGVFFGIGFYSIDGQNITEDDTGLGLTLGVDGDFRLTDRWSFVLEFSGHYADLEYAQFFIMGHGGLAFHF